MFVTFYRHVLSAAVLALGLTAYSEAAQIIGLESPNSFVGDPSGKDYFISNINGEPDARDNNGFITKLDTEGKITNSSLSKAVSRMCCCTPQGNGLDWVNVYIADLDQLKGFDKTTGKLLATVSFPSPTDRFR